MTCLIIGAGISGLSMARYATGAGLDTLILEQARQANVVWIHTDFVGHWTDSGWKQGA